MSAPTLPAEILDLIFELVQPKSSLPTRQSLQSPPILAVADHESASIASSQQSLASLALTSKQFLSPARIHLYSRPLVQAFFFTRGKAQSLLSSLTSNQGNLGRLVRTLQGIAPCLFRLFELVASPPDSLLEWSEKPVIFSWYLHMLKTCPELVKVDLHFSTCEDSVQIATALQSAASTLKVVNLVKVPSGLIEQALHSRCFGKVETVKLENVNYIAGISLSLPIQTLRFGIGCPVTRFRLGDLTNFQTLSVECSGGAAPEFSNFVISIAPALRHLRYGRSSYRGKYNNLSLFYAQSSHFGILSTLPHLSELTSIRIYSITADFLAILSILTRYSPFLTIIDFHGSNWARRDDKRFGVEGTVEEHYGRACPEDELVNLFVEGFKSLTEVDLGVLPTTDEKAYEAVRIGCRGRGVRASWEVCSLEDPWRTG